MHQIKQTFFMQAVKDEDHIWGYVVTGTNHNGHTTTPITAPSSTKQVALLKHVYVKHNVNPATIQYIEAHGNKSNPN